MTTYRNIHGRSIKAVSTDPTAEVTEGEIWYNTNSETFKSVLNLEAWSTSAPLTTARTGIAHFGTQTAAVAAGGSPYPGIAGETEEYNGTGWASATALPGNTGLAGAAGTETAGLVFGGIDANPGNTNSINSTREYDGSSWTSGGNMGNERSQTSGFGTQTAAVVAAGFLSTTTTTANSEEYNGTAWSEGNNANNARRNTGATGIESAGIMFGGGPPAAPNNHSEEYDGTSWSEGNNLNTARLMAPQTGAGPQTNAIAFGGNVDPPVSNATENYDGTSWTTKSVTMSTARAAPGCGSATAIVAGGGRTTANVGTTEEYNNSVNIFVQGAWATGNAANTARNNPGSGGSAAAGIAISGSVNATEFYNGDTFVAGPNVNTHAEQHFSTGTQGACVKAGGSGGNQTEEWNGESWSNVPGGLNNYPRNAGGSAGTLTASVMFGGNNPPGPVNAVSHTEEYNGTSFSEVNNMTTARFGMNGGMGGAAQTAAIAIGGFTPPVTNAVEEYDGTNWSNGGSLLIAAQKPGLGGTQTAIMVAGNELPAVTSYCQVYDGTSFTSAPALNAVQSSGSSAGTSTDMWFALGGNGTANVTTNQEFTGGSSGLNVKTLTQS